MDTIEDRCNPWYGRRRQLNQPSLAGTTCITAVRAFHWKTYLQHHTLLEATFSELYMQHTQWLLFLSSVKDPDPRQYGYELVNGFLVPIAFHRLIPEDLVSNYTACTSCVRSSCPCKSNNILCSDFCSCQRNRVGGTAQCANLFSAYDY